MAMKPVVYKLGSLCARMDVLKEEVAAMRKEIDKRKKMLPPMDIDLNISSTGHDSPVGDMIPPDDWCAGFVMKMNCNDAWMNEFLHRACFELI
ncbi:hypothetical protein HAX54_004546 [Datura stramonium]|uniref:Uncharacterized protein n=1 Tax=Datura stramonium TaxID=4076 RepID=A0ABS8T8F6_DATST|nr:hypothetical protein [Datura stramonium]